MRSKLPFRNRQRHAGQRCAEPHLGKEEIGRGSRLDTAQPLHRLILGKELERDRRNARDDVIEENRELATGAIDEQAGRIDLRRGHLFDAPEVPLDKAEQAAQCELIQKLDQLAAREFPEDKALVARMKSYQLAFKMQAAVPETMNLDSESADTKRLYGLEDKVTEPFARELCGGDHACGDRGTVRQVVVRRGFESMADSVTVVQDRTQPAFQLVLGDNQCLEADGVEDEGVQCAEIPVPRSLDPVEVFEVFSP